MTAAVFAGSPPTSPSFAWATRSACSLPGSPVSWSSPSVTRMGSDRAPPPVARASSLSGDLPYEKLLEVLDRRVRLFSEALQERNRALGRVPLQPLRPCEGSVRFKKSLVAMLEHFAVASERMQALLPRREAMLAEFGGGCDQIAHTRALLAAAQQGLGAEGEEARLRRCAQNLDSVERVLADCGLQERLREARERWERTVQGDFEREAAPAAPASPSDAKRDAGSRTPRGAGRTAQVVPEPIAVPDENAATPGPVPALAERVETGGAEEPEKEELPLAPRQPDRSARKFSRSAAELLAAIDEPDKGEDMSELMDELFDHYSEGSEMLEGKDDPASSYSRAVGDMVKYLQMEWSAREERLKRKMGKDAVLGPLSDERAREWVLKAVDLNGDGCITKEEAYLGFKTVVDEVDPPSPFRKN